MTDALSPIDATARVNRSGEELAMRVLVVERLRALWPGARIIHELPLRYSTRRIDLAAVTLDQIVAVEIKSSRDAMDRLEAQLRGFVPVASVLICALAPKWNVTLPMLEERRDDGGRVFRQQFTEPQRIISSIGHGIETWTVDADAGKVEGAKAPWPWQVSKPWAWRLLDVLHVAELSEIADRHRVAAKRTHWPLVQACAEMMTGREVSRAVCRALRRRDAFDKSSDRPVLDEVTG